MAGKFNLALVMAVALLATMSLLQTSSAQRTHIVGDALGWLVPPNGRSAYATWAANQTFVVGDIIVFNFTTGNHDVAEVTRANFDGCNTRSPIMVQTNSPANITLSSAGEHYYICRFSGHCDAGQKLAINVTTAASSPSPSPSPSRSPQPPAPTPQPSGRTPSPAPSRSPTPTPSSTPTSAPTPAPTGSPVSYVVGDTAGWTVPTDGSGFYDSWARDKNFMVGDILVFNYSNGRHNVEEVTEQAYDSCNTNNPISTSTNPPTRITLRTAGNHYFLCGFPGHCAAGQKLTVNVGGNNSGMPPSSSATPPSTAGSPTATVSPPSDNSAGQSLHVAGLSATFLAVVVGYMLS